jgi:hypothetical protein
MQDEESVSSANRHDVGLEDMLYVKGERSKNVESEDLPYNRGISRCQVKFHVICQEYHTKFAWPVRRTSVFAATPDRSRQSNMYQSHSNLQLVNIVIDSHLYILQTLG